MGKDSGSSAPQSSTVVNSNLPPELLPYAQDILNQGEKISNQPYVGYGGDRLAPLSAFTNQAYDQTQNFGNQAQPLLNNGINAQYNAYTTAANVAQNPLSAPDQVKSQNWTDPGVAQSYMNPYETNVLQSQLNLANQQFGEQQNQRNSSAVQAGAFGGDRAALVNEAAQRDFNNSNNQMVAQGLSGAYNTGQQAFQAGNSANLLAQEANQQSQLSTNQLNSSNELNSAGLQNTIGGQMQATGQSGINALYNAGQSQQNYTQQGENIAYNDFVNQQQYPEQQLNFLSGLMHGFNVSPNSYSTTQSTYTNPTTQLIGAGTGIAGIASALKGG